MIGWNELFILKVALYQGVVSGENLKNLLLLSERQRVSLYQQVEKQLDPQLLQKIIHQAQSLKSWPDHPQNISRENQLIAQKLHGQVEAHLLQKSLEGTQKLVATGQNCRLHEFFLKRGLFSVGKIQEILNLRGETAYHCQSCKIGLTIIHTLPWRKYPCLFCDGYLEAHDNSGQTRDELDLQSPQQKTSLGREFGRYQLLGKLGQGGAGVVYLAYDPFIQRKVALKIIFRQGDEERMEKRFRREVKLASKLHHPSIVSIQDVGQEKRFLFFTMDYIEGEDLRQYVKRKGKMSQKGALKIMVQVCEAIGYAHSQQVLHRDVKPENILLDKEMVPHLVDFGLAKVLSAQETRVTKSGALVGSPEFMSPEQAKGKKIIDYRADVYALGATLYFLIAGKPPFGGSEFMEVIFKVIGQPPPPPSNFNHLIKRDLEQVILRCLEKEPDDRYATAEELQKDLQALLRGDPVEIRGNSFVEKIFHFVQVQKKIFLASVVVMALILGFVYGPFQSKKDRTKTVKPRIKKGQMDQVRQLASRGSFTSALLQLTQIKKANRSDGEKGRLFFWSALIQWVDFSLSPKIPLEGRRILMDVLKEKKLKIPPPLYHLVVSKPQFWETYSALERDKKDRKILRKIGETFQKASFLLKDPQKKKVAFFYRALVAGQSGHFLLARSLISKILHTAFVQPEILPYLYLHRARLSLILNEEKKAEEDIEKIRQATFYPAQRKFLIKLVDLLKELKKRLDMKNQDILSRLFSRSMIEKTWDKISASLNNIAKLGKKGLPCLRGLMYFLRKKAYWQSDQLIQKIIKIIVNMGQPALLALVEWGEKEPEKLREKLIKKMGALGKEELAPLLRLAEQGKINGEMILSLPFYSSDFQGESLANFYQKHSAFFQKFAGKFQKNSPAKFRILLLFLLDSSRDQHKKLGLSVMMALSTTETNSTKWKTVQLLISLKDPKLLPLMIKIFRTSPDLNIKEKLASAFVTIGHPSVVYLLKALKDKNSSTQYHSARVLVKIGALKTLFANLSIDSLNDSILYALQEIPTADFKNSLLPVLQGTSPTQRIVAIKILGHFAGKTSFAISPLTNLLESPDGPIVQQTAIALGRYGKKARSAIPALKKRLLTARGKLRLAIQESLAKIDKGN